LLISSLLGGAIYKSDPDYVSGSSFLDAKEKYSSELPPLFQSLYIYKASRQYKQVMATKTMQ
jgi:hypothetical protein